MQNISTYSRLMMHLKIRKDISIHWKSRTGQPWIALICAGNVRQLFPELPHEKTKIIILWHSRSIYKEILKNLSPYAISVLYENVLYAQWEARQGKVFHFFLKMEYGLPISQKVLYQSSFGKETSTTGEKEEYYPK